MSEISLEAKESREEKRLSHRQVGKEVDALRDIADAVLQLV